jgi:hypothetical protein
MKRTVYILIALVIIISSFGCSTKLRIVNETSYTLDLISWIGESGRIYWFGNDWVYDSVLYTYVQGMYPGSSDEQSVEPGHSPVFFWLADGITEYYTCEIVGVEKWQNQVFVLTDNTLVYITGTNAKGLKEMIETIEKTSSGDELKKLKKYNSM